MPKRDPRMVPLGYGKFVRADRVFALVPLERAERRDGRRTYVHVDGLSEPIVASRSERAIMADVEQALAEAAGIPRRRQDRGGRAGELALGPQARQRASRRRASPYSSFTSASTDATDSLASPNSSAVFSL